VNPAGVDLGEWLRLALPLFLGGLIYWLVARRGGWRRETTVAVGDIDDPYRVYTRDHDRILAAKDVPAALEGHRPDGAQARALRDPDLWAAEVHASRAVLATYTRERSERLRQAIAADLASAPPGDWAVCILVDQSGSMRGDGMRNTSAATRWLADNLHAMGLHTALLGFTTLGWQGGEPRRHWLKAGRPERPGRLCALLHIVYQDFGSPLSERDWEVMLRPDLLRENVDGEALDWAYGLLKVRTERYKLLLVISDGAPVDDSTLMQNGGTYMERHLRSVIETIEADTSVTLAAFGVGFEVSRYYQRSASVAEIPKLPEALSGLVTKSIAEMVRSQ
jgi:cobaltochelatase CobT